MIDVIWIVLTTITFMGSINDAKRILRGKNERDKISKLLEMSIPPIQFRSKAAFFCVVTKTSNFKFNL